jgi:hypothetical protein
VAELLRSELAEAKQRELQIADGREPRGPSLLEYEAPSHTQTRGQPARAGRKLALYVSDAVASDLALLAERFPGDHPTGLLRRALSHLAAEALAELVELDAARSQQEAYGAN